MPCTIKFVTEAIKQLRANEAETEHRHSRVASQGFTGAIPSPRTSHGPPLAKDLWRGVKGAKADGTFLKQGGTECCPVSIPRPLGSLLPLSLHSPLPLLC